MLAALDAYLHRQYPPEEFGQEVDHILDVDALLRPDILFVGAWRNENALGCGAVRRCRDEHGPFGEVKRMWVEPWVRGQRVGERILASLEAAMQAEGVRRLFLETGNRQPEALRLYERCGWRRCPPYAGYAPHPANIFMERLL